MCRRAWPAHAAKEVAAGDPDRGECQRSWGGVDPKHSIAISA